MSQVFPFKKNPSDANFQHTFKFTIKKDDGFWETREEFLYCTFGKGQSAWDAVHTRFKKDYPNAIIINHFID